MTQLTNYGENKLADFMRGQALTLPTSWYFALASAASDTGITELSGTGYARVAVARTGANFNNTQSSGTGASTGTTHQTGNTAAISWGVPGSAWGTASFVGVMDASTGGNAWFWLPLPTPIVITTGSPSPVQIAAGVMNFVFGLVSGASDYLANKLIDLLFRGFAFSWPATLYTALYTTAPNNADGGSEVAGGSYARASLVPSLTSLSSTDAPGGTTASTGTAGRISNNAAVSYPAPTADWGTVVAEGIRDAAAAGNLLFWGLLAVAKTIGAGAPAPSHAPDTLGITIA